MPLSQSVGHVIGIHDDEHTAELHYLPIMFLSKTLIPQRHEGSVGYQDKYRDLSSCDVI